MSPRYWTLVARATLPRLYVCKRSQRGKGRLTNTPVTRSEKDWHLSLGPSGYSSRPVSAASSPTVTRNGRIAPEDRHTSRRIRRTRESPIRLHVADLDIRIVTFDGTLLWHRVS